jgi:hypothetical protein
VSVSIPEQTQATICLRLDPSVECADDEVLLELPASFGRDGLSVRIEAQAQDNGPARRFARSATLEATVVDTSPPEVQLFQPERLDPDRSLALRVRVFDRHSGAAALAYRLRILSNGCVAQTISGSLTGFIPQSDHELAIIAVPVPADLRSGTLAIEQLEVADRAATANKASIEARELCIGSCADTTPPSVSITRVRWLIDGQTAQALNPGDGVHPGAQLEVTVSGTDEHSNLRQLWGQIDGEPAAPPEDTQACPDLTNTREETFQLQAPEGPDGQAFVVRAGGFDDVGSGADHNAGLAENFALELNDDVAPVIAQIQVLDEAGSLAVPEVEGSLRLGVSATDTFGSIARIQLRIEDQEGDQAAQSDVEVFDPVQAELSDYASPTVLELPQPNDRRATSDWTARVTLWDDATPPNPTSATIGFLPTDGQAPTLAQVSGGGAINLSNGRLASVQISGTDAARYVASVGLADLVVGQTEVSTRPVSTNLPANRASAEAVAVAIAVPIDAKEGTISAVPRITDDSGNVTTGQRVSFNLVDNVRPSVSAVFNPNILVPGGPVRLEVSATDANSTGIAQIQVANVQHITWTNQSISNQGNVVFTGTVAADPGSIGNGLPVQAAVTVTDQAAGSNQRVVNANATIRDEAGPIITVLEVSEGTVGGTGTLRIRAQDIGGVVAQTSYATSINRFNSNNQYQRNETVNYGQGNRFSSQEQEFSVTIPNQASEGQYSIVFTATDGEGNETQFTATGNLRLAVVDRNAPDQVSINSVPSQLDTGGNRSVRVTARDVSSGIATLRLVASELNQTLTHNCNNDRVCTHTFALPVASDAAHQLSVNLVASAIDGSAQSNTTTPAATTRAVRDVEAPTQVAINNPLPVQIDTGDSLQLQLRGQDVSSGLATAQITVPCGSSGPHTFNNQPKNLISVNEGWTVPSGCDAVGVQDVQVRMIDAAGNTSDPATLSLTIVDVTAPVVSFRSPPTVTNTSSAEANIPVRITDAGSGVARATLSASCGTVSNGGSLTIGGAPSLSNPSFLLTDVQNCPPGIVTLTLGGQDVAGNSATPVQHLITLRDNQAPTTLLALSSTTVDVSTSVTLTATVTDGSSGLASLSFSVPCGSVSAPHPVTFAGETTEQVVQRTWTVPANCRTLGSQDVSVTVADQSTFSADGSQTVAVTLRDLTNPTLIWDNPPTELSLTNGATMSANATDASSGVASVSFSLADPSQGSFSPTSRVIGGAPTDADAATALSATSSLTHGTEVIARAQAQDVSGNDSAVASATLTIVDDIEPANITAVPQLASNRVLGPGRFAVAAGESVIFDVGASDPNSGIATVHLRVTAGGNTTTVGSTAGNGAVNFATTIQVDVPGGAADGDEVTVRPRADDVSNATSFVAGAALVLVVDATAPATPPALASPILASTFGAPQTFRCLNAANAGLAGLRGTVDTVAVNVQVAPLPAGFSAQGEEASVAIDSGAWSLIPAGYSWANHTEYTVTLRARDAVGNLEVTGASFTLRGDLVDGSWTASPSFDTSVVNKSSGRADYQPVMTGTRTATTGGSMLVTGQFACGTLSNQGDSTAGTGAYTITEPNTLSLGQNNALSCAWSLQESFCGRVRTSSGTTNLSKVNAAPQLPSNPRVAGDDQDPATINELWPTLNAASDDSFDIDTNQISQSRSVEIRVYDDANAVIWDSGALSASVASGADFSANFPAWRPPDNAMASGHGRAVRRNNEVYWFGLGLSPDVHILDLDKNVWTNTPEQMVVGDVAEEWSASDGVTPLADGSWLRVTANGEHLSGSDTGGTVTWDHLGDIPSFPTCSAVRLTTLGATSSRALLWCQNGADQLLTYVVNEPQGIAVEWTVEQITTNTVTTVTAAFQVTRLGSTNDYRLVPGIGANQQVHGARLDPGGLVESWTTSPTATGDNLTLATGCSIAAQSGTSYLVLGGGNGAWAGTAAADPTSDSLAAADLPGGLIVNGSGQHLASGDGAHEAIALVWHLTHGLRPVVWVEADDAYQEPPDPADNESALVHGASYSWGSRLTDEGGDSGSFPNNANRQSFSVSIP